MKVWIILVTGLWYMYIEGFERHPRTKIIGAKHKSLFLGLRVFLVLSEVINLIEAGRRAHWASQV